MSTDMEKIKKGMKKRTAVKKPIYLSTGSTLLNLGCSGETNGGFPTGSYVFLVGDSMSGKTWLSLTCMAEAARDKRFADYRFIYDNVERGARMSLKRYFGEDMASRIEAPATDKDGQPSYSTFVEEFYFNVDDAFEVGKPFIYVLDSMDALDTLADDEKFNEWKEAFKKGKESKGSFGMNKAKFNSTAIRSVISKLEKSDSLLIVISQTRDNVDPKNPFQTKTRSGGKSLRFYATLELWSSVKNNIKKVHKGKQYKIGVNLDLSIKKNRLVGRENEVTIPIYYSYGLDNTGSCVDYLVSSGVWEQSKQGMVTVSGMGPTLEGKTMRRERLIQHIEENGLLEDLTDLVGQEWQTTEQAIALERKPRYE